MRGDCVSIGCEGFSEVESVSVDVVKMAAGALLPSGKGIRDGYGVAAVVVKILLGVGWFDMDRGAKLTWLMWNTVIQKSDMGG